MSNPIAPTDSLILQAFAQLGSDLLVDFVPPMYHHSQLIYSLLKVPCAPKCFDFEFIINKMTKPLVKTRSGT